MGMGTHRYDAAIRLGFYMVAALFLGCGAGLKWGLPAFLIVLGAVMLLWCLLVDVKLIVRP